MKDWIAQFRGYRRIHSKFGRVKSIKSVVREGATYKGEFRRALGKAANKLKEELRGRVDC